MNSTQPSSSRRIPFINKKGQKPTPPSSSSPLSNPATEKLARSAVSRVGSFLLTKCAKKKSGENGDGCANDEYFLADGLHKPTEETKNMLAKFEKQIKAKVTDELKAPTPKTMLLIGFKTQQVSGTDYFLKVKATNSGQYFHVRIYESLQQDLILQDVSGPKLNSDLIEIVS